MPVPQVARDRHLVDTRNNMPLRIVNKQDKVAAGQYVADGEEIDLEMSTLVLWTLATKLP